MSRVSKPQERVTLVMKRRGATLPLTLKSAMKLELNRADSTLVESDIVDSVTIETIAMHEMDRSIADMIHKSRKVVVVTGAGISCNAGIPDFRSSDGYYQQTVNGPSKVKGKDMFDVGVYRSVESIEMFNQFIREMYQQVKFSQPTKTHEFIKKLKLKNKLVKCYTQNIDGLERKLGLRCEFNDSNWEKKDVVQLHGDLHLLSCSSCKDKFTWEQIYNEAGLPHRTRDIQKELEMMQKRDQLLGIQSPPVSDESEMEDEDSGNEEIEITGTQSNINAIVECPSCLDQYEQRLELGKRSCESNIGIIRPNIVLYGENHPYAETFAQGIKKDLNKRPNMMLVFGTSLKVNGVKGLVRDMAKKVHSEGGKVVLINRDPVSVSSWKGYIDYQVIGDCDEFCARVENYVPKMFYKKKPAASATTTTPAAAATAAVAIAQSPC